MALSGTLCPPLIPTRRGCSSRIKAQFVDSDPGHSFEAIREHIFGSNNASANPPPMNGFTQQASSMNGFDPEMVAAYKSLVSKFAPNRLYVHSATSSGATINIPSLLIKAYPERKIFKNLDDAGISWGIYYQNIPSTLFYKNLRKLKCLFNFRPYGLSFKKHAKEGKLPGYVVVEQRYVDTKVEPANDDHPSHDVYEGQMFVKEVYES
ncbi:Non-specific phospholipase C2 [Hibiscus syriacus]|uniref:Non-specific phospholipase C2 n=1 Tax=Hibiscus syriacus TaxID=106335 RepID=A0A6A3B8H8_HIBSY|nr:Non-specific phospholipase C2 [Hibiscus syriacus]